MPRAAPDHPALASVLRSVLSANLETLCRAAIGQAATHTDLDLLLGTTTAAAALDRRLTVITVDPLPCPLPWTCSLQGRTKILSPLALTLTDHYTNHCRRLAAGNQAAYEPALAASLNKVMRRPARR